ncbi:uncharacterized protein LOC126973182 [Leptidea sinapis]|uniref:uncharacterized protein LOC126973182 n=1 Tax=Leptidea sinapis TaxID=189913 RepID=UPI0021C49F16|nr:uncharacterized protein LOC126973182 [Leptidea sinapis]
MRKLMVRAIECSSNILKPATGINTIAIIPGGDKASRTHSGGNPVCPRETPKWQKPITNFFLGNQTSTSNGSDDVTAGTSKTKPKRNIIESDDEIEEINKGEVHIDSPPKNRELDESLVLEPLTGENSHRIEEYYTPKTSKGKGQGIRGGNKENINRRGSKRELEVSLDENSHANKKKKVK